MHLHSSAVYVSPGHTGRQIITSRNSSRVLRAQHLKDLTSSRYMAPHIAANVTKALTKVVNLFASGKAAPGAAE